MSPSVHILFSFRRPCINRYFIWPGNWGLTLQQCCYAVEALLLSLNKHYKILKLWQNALTVQYRPLPFSSSFTVRHVFLYQKESLFRTRWRHSWSKWSCFIHVVKTSLKCLIPCFYMSLCLICQKGNYFYSFVGGSSGNMDLSLEIGIEPICAILKVIFIHEYNGILLITFFSISVDMTRS